MAREPIGLDTKVDPVEAAIAVAQFCPLDPATYLERSGLAGVTVGLTPNGSLYEFYGDCEGYDRDQATFLRCWLNLTPGGSDAVIALLKQRTA